MTGRRWLIVLPAAILGAVVTGSLSTFVIGLLASVVAPPGSHPSEAQTIDWLAKFSTVRIACGSILVPCAFVVCGAWVKTTPRVTVAAILATLIIGVEVRNLIIGTSGSGSHPPLGLWILGATVGFTLIWWTDVRKARATARDEPQQTQVEQNTN